MRLEETPYYREWFSSSQHPGYRLLHNALRMGRMDHSPPSHANCNVPDSGRKSRIIPTHGASGKNEIANAHILYSADSFPAPRLFDGNAWEIDTDAAEAILHERGTIKKTRRLPWAGAVLVRFAEVLARERHEAALAFLAKSSPVLHASPTLPVPRRSGQVPLRPSGGIGEKIVALRCKTRREHLFRECGLNDLSDGKHGVDAQSDRFESLVACGVLVVRDRRDIGHPEPRV